MQTQQMGLIANPREGAAGGNDKRVGVAMELGESTLWAVAKKVLDGHGAAAKAYASSQIKQLEAAGDFVSASAWSLMADRIDLLIDQSGRELPTRH